jgi:hypothetical protein
MRLSEKELDPLPFISSLVFLSLSSFFRFIDARCGQTERALLCTRWCDQLVEKLAPNLLSARHALRVDTLELLSRIEA